MDKKTNPPKGCIFCGGGPMSREHVRAAWIAPYLPDTFVGTAHDVGSAKIDPATDNRMEGSMAKGILNLKGDHRGRRLKVVCVECNNGWMSKLQNAAKPLMLPMILGTPATQLSSQDCTILAAWATMYTMVYEFAHLATLATPQAERTEFMINGRPPSGWKVWVGRYDSAVDNGGRTWHRAMGLLLPGSDQAVSDHCNVQITTIAIRDLYLQTFSSAVHSTPRASIGVDNLAGDFGLWRIWPIENLPVSNATLSGHIGPTEMFHLISEFPEAARFVAF